MTGDAGTVPTQAFDNKNAGTGKILIPGGLVITDGNSGLNYSIMYINSSTGIITAKPLTVTPSIPVLYINERNPLPVITFNFSGAIAGDNISCSVTVLRDKDNVPYDMNSSNSAGKYFANPVLCNTNYSFASVTPGILYVNSNCHETHAVIPVLKCVMKLSDGPGLNYVANFEYKNDNNVDVYIPVGSNNKLLGNYGPANSQPVLFKAGGGSFSVNFDGKNLSWTVTSRDDEHNVTKSVTANSNSTKCGSQPKSAVAVQEDIIKESDAQPLDLVAYPNPVTDRVNISMKGIESYSQIQVYDYSGKSQPVTNAVKGQDLVEIDMSALSPGTYFIKIVIDYTSRIFTVIKK
jgi:hypothetical protein